MATCEIAPELNLRKIIAESREFAQAVNEFADDLERIEKKYAKDTCEDFKQESEEDVVEAEEEQEPKSPCDLCRFNPPSSCDGKPCTMCLAQATERFKDKLENGYFRKRREK